MRAVIAEKIYLEGIPDKARSAIKKALSLRNPMFWKMKKMGKPYVHLSEYIRYYEEDKRTGRLAFGRGVEARLREYAERQGVALEVEERCAFPHVALHSNITLREYQSGVPEAVVNGGRCGIARLDTGFGKTIIALRVAEILQTRTLIIVPRTNIYEQFAHEIKTYFGREPGTIDDVFSPGLNGPAIVVCTMQALQRRIDRVGLSDDARTRFGLIIVDEAHTTVPTKSRKVVQSFSARHVYGFTATARRTDEQGEALNFIYGPILVDRKMERATPTVEIFSYGDRYDVDEYHFMVEAQTKDNVRRIRVADIVAREARDGRRVLVLTKRVLAYEALAELLANETDTRDIETIALSSGGSKKDRATLLRALRNGDRKYQVLLGTFSLLSTGVDIPSLDTLVIAGDLRSDVLAEQSAGRILRLFDGKRPPKIIDIADVNNPIFWSQAKARRKFYESQNWEVKAYG